MQENVIIFNEKEFNRKVEQIKKEGLDSLHVITDFDKTLTTAEVNGKEFKSVIALLREDDYLGADYIEKAHALYDKYHHYENDYTLSFEERSKKMDSWWQEHLDLHIKKGLNRAVISRLCNDIEQKIKFRAGIEEFITILKNRQVPLLVFSAGLGDVIEYFFKKKNLLHNNLSIISNFYNYGTKGNITGYKGRIIHSGNKGEIAIAKDKHFSKIRNRKNVILLGDSLGDLTMANGVDHKEIIKIGFLSKSKDPQNFKGYDVLILNDGALDFVVELLKKLD